MDLGTAVSLACNNNVRTAFLLQDNLVSHFKKDAAARRKKYQTGLNSKDENRSLTLENNSIPNSADDVPDRTLSASGENIPSKNNVKSESDSDEGCDVLEEILNLNKEQSEVSPSQPNEMSDPEGVKKDTNQKGSDSVTVTSSTSPSKSPNKKMVPSVQSSFTSHVNVQAQEEELDFLLSLETPHKENSNVKEVMSDSGE